MQSSSERVREPDNRWVAALLGLIAAVAAVAYAWRANSQVVEVFYAAAVRSMSMSWHNFLFGAFDPAGTVSIDKLPGAFWVQALSVRIFGVHTWAIVLPQIIEGVASVLVLFAIVRRHAGAMAGLLAAALLAVSPAAVALNRGNISDSLLILLMLLAADATTRAGVTGRLRTLLLAGLFAGLAFQAKMLEAWILLPSLAAVYLLTAPGSARRRIGHLGAAGVVVVVVSLAWMTFVTLTPGHDRPYADGSQNNSVFAQVFDYNGLGRVESPLAAAGASDPVIGNALSAFTVRHGPGWDRLLVGSAGREIAWLLPAAVLAAAALLLARRRRPRTDPVRAGAVLWGLWLVTLLLAFSIAGQLNPYYLAALSPPIAALCALGATEVWRAGTRTALAGLGVVSLLTSAYAVALLPGRDAPGWLAVVTAILGVAALVAAAVAAARPGRAVAATALAAVVLAGALVPTTASVTLVADHRGPFDTPFQPPAVTAFTQGLAGAVLHPPPATVAVFERTVALFRYPLAAYTSLLAAPLIYATGDEVLPIGGFQGTNPSPTLAGLKRLIGLGQLGLFLAPPAPDRRIAWVRANCQALPVTGPLPVYSCRRG